MTTLFVERLLGEKGAALVEGEGAEDREGGRSHLCKTWIHTYIHTYIQKEEEEGRRRQAHENTSVSSMCLPTVCMSPVSISHPLNHLPTYPLINPPTYLPTYLDRRFHRDDKRGSFGAQGDQ